MKTNLKNILVVGGTGFLGYHLLKFLVKKNYLVTSLSTKPPTNERKVKKVHYVYANIDKFKNLNFLKKNFKFIINLSGYINHSNIKRTYKTHYKGCVNLYEKFKLSKLSKFIQIGSSLEYGSLKSPQKETKPNKKIILNSIYSKSKFLASRFLLEKNKKNNFPVVILRLYQVYGPNQDANRLIPFVIKNCLSNKSFNCSDGNQFRDFLYVDDFVNAIYKVLKKKVNGKVINIGYGKPMRVRTVINKIYSKIKKGNPIFGKVKLRPDENKICYPSIIRANQILKWKPKIKFNVGLMKTINYYKQ